MADETTQGQEDQQENLEPAEQTAENPDVSQQPVSPTGGDLEAKLAALEARLERERERNEQLETSVRIQERYWQQQQSQNGGTRQAQQPTDDDEPLSQELDVLDKALTPLLNKRFKSVLDPFTKQYSAMADTQDATRFEMFLTRNHPEVLEDDDEYNKVMQQVNQVREAAISRGMPSISRVDAFIFARGLDDTRNKISQRKQKRGTIAVAETKRAAEVKVAQATSNSGAPRTNENAGIQAIREKANRGERLSQPERDKLRDYVSRVEF